MLTKKKIVEQDSESEIETEVKEIEHEISSSSDTDEILTLEYLVKNKQEELNYEKELENPNDVKEGSWALVHYKTTKITKRYVGLILEVYAKEDKLLFNFLRKKRNKKIREETLTDERVAIHHINNTTPENLQKLTETIFHKTDTKVVIGTTASNREAKKVKTTYGMIISDGEKTYKEVPGRVKTIVGSNSSVKAIRSVRSTKDGKLLLTIKKDQTAFNNLHNALKDSTMGLKTRRLGLEKSIAIHLRGMEADTTLEDIKKSIIEITGKWEDDK
ncbi:unnamed protein product [Psylliodes chrysocephalus]|uniref:Uncharacterized protein n=1 Tax=Psylliodes chrysocephalus TaxID=3402493 RepID=A0A9P0CXI2_9CUCU|nr:unnamed protein product [Psylliodes chrysocephala]